MSAVTILAIVAIFLAVIALVPAWRDYPALAVAVLLLGVCVLLQGGAWIR